MTSRATRLPAFFALLLTLAASPLVAGQAAPGGAATKPGENQAAKADEEIAALEKQIDDLLAEHDKQLRKLGEERNKLREIEAKLNALGARLDLLKCGGRREGHRSKPATNDNDKKAAKCVLAMLSTMPEAIQPDLVTGWDMLRFPRVREWFEKNARGKAFEGEVFPYHLDTHYRRNGMFTMTIKYRPRLMGLVFKGMPIQLSVGVGEYPWYNSIFDVTHEGDEAAVRKWFTGLLIVKGDETAFWDRLLDFKKHGADEEAAKEWLLKGAPPCVIRGRIGKAYLTRRFRTYDCTIRLDRPKLFRAPPKRKPITEPTPSDAAKSRLSLARAYLSSGLREKAKLILREIIERYPGSKHAAEAKTILDDMGK